GPAELPRPPTPRRWTCPAPRGVRGRRLGAHRSFGCLLDTAVPPSRATLPVLSAHYSAGRHFGRPYAERDEAVALVKPHKRRRALASTANSQPQHSLSSLVAGRKCASPRPRLPARPRRRDGVSPAVCKWLPGEY